MHKNTDNSRQSEGEASTNSVSQLAQRQVLQPAFSDNRQRSALVDKSTTALQLKPNPKQHEGAYNLFSSLQSAQSEAVNDSTSTDEHRTVRQLRSNLSDLDTSESAQFKAAGVCYNTAYAKKIPQRIGVKGTQVPIGATAQLQDLGVTGYTAQTKTSVDQPIVQMVRTPHGLQAQLYTGSHVVVTQMHIGHDIWDGIKKAGTVAKKYSTAILLAAESVLTITAGIAGCTINPVAGVAAIIVGILKSVRAILSFIDTKEDGANPAAEAERKKWSDAIRGVEAGLALIMALVGLPNPDLSTWTKVTSTIFASTKSLRSLLILCGADQYTLGKKIINGLQLVEGASVLTGGFAAATSSTASTANEVIGVSSVLVGASKMERGREGMVKAFNPPVHAGPQPDESADQVRKVAMEIGEEIGQMYGGWSKTQIEEFADDESGRERARIRIANRAEPTPSYIS